MSCLQQEAQRGSWPGRRWLGQVPDPRFCLGEATEKPPPRPLPAPSAREPPRPPPARRCKEPSQAFVRLRSDPGGGTFTTMIIRDIINVTIIATPHLRWRRGASFCFLRPPPWPQGQEKSWLQDVRKEEAEAGVGGGEVYVRLWGESAPLFLPPGLTVR